MTEANAAGYGSKRPLYNLILASAILTPAFAAVPVGFSAIVFIAVVIAFFYLAIVVLPSAFVGLAIGWYLIREQDPNGRIRNAIICYCAGFAGGLEIVCLFIIGPIIQSMQLILVGAFAGLIIPLAFINMPTARDASSH